MRSPARYLAILAAVAFFPAAVVVVFNWIYDPWQFYRRTMDTPEFTKQSRYQNVGLAKNYPYEGVVLGTSVSLGYDQQDLAELLGGQPINLAMSGAAAHEQRLLLDVVLRAGRARHIVWDMNYEFFRGQADWTTEFDGGFPGFLYDQNPLNEIPNYLLNIDATKGSLHVLLRRLRHQPAPYTLEELSGSRRGKAFGTQPLAPVIPLRRWPPARHPEDFAPALTAASFDHNVLEPIRSHPEIQWDLWFTPFQMDYHKMMDEQLPQGLENMFTWKRHILAQLRGMAHVRLYDFQGMRGLTTSHEHYIDIVHFDRETHRLLLQKMRSNEYLATPENLASTEAFIRAEVAKLRTRGGAEPGAPVAP